MKQYRNRKKYHRTALCIALGMCFSTAVFAQSNTSGAIFGQAAGGSTVQVINPSTGFSRSVTVGNDGAYRFSALPTGTYTVTLQGADGASAVREGVNVNVGTGTSVNFTSSLPAAAPRPLDARRRSSAPASVNPIDVSSVESTTILTAEQIAKIPVPRDTTSVALLAPGTVRGDAAFGNLASFGGSSVAENQYYVNGFNITNSFRNLNFAQDSVRGDRRTADQDRRLRRRIRSLDRRRGQPDHQARHQRVPCGRQHLLVARLAAFGGRGHLLRQPAGCLVTNGNAAPGQLQCFAPTSGSTRPGPAAH